MYNRKKYKKSGEPNFFFLQILLIPWSIQSSLQP